MGVNQKRIFFIISLLNILLPFIVCGGGHEYRNNRQDTNIQEGQNLSGTKIKPSEESTGDHDHTMNKLDSKIEEIIKTSGLLIEYLRTDGDPSNPPTAGIGWIALFILFTLLSPMLIPLALSPIVLIGGYFIFLAYDLSKKMQLDEGGRHFITS